MSFAERRTALRRSVPLIVLAAMGASCTMPTIDGAPPAYDPTSLTGGTLYHWTPGQAIAVHVVASDAAELESAIRFALRQWATALAYREHTLRLVSRPEDADILVRARATALPVDTAGCSARGASEAVGQTLFCAAGDSARTLELVSGPPGHIKVLITVDMAGIDDPNELLAVSVHEVGHALGIGGHSDTAADIMFPVPQTNLPSPRDARTLRYVLHRRPDLTL